MDFQECIESKFLTMFEPFKRILKHYSCPESCKATCCKLCDIQFGKLEYKTISEHNYKAKKVLETKAELISQTTQTGFDLIGYHFKEKPCPFLKRDRCSIRDVRPITCVLYPFVLAKFETNRDLVSLEPCPMGVEVMADYLLFKCLAVYYSDMTNEDKQRMIEEDLRLFSESIETVDNMLTEEGNVLDLGIHRDVIDLFADFLDDNPEENRLKDREGFGIESIKKSKRLIPHKDN